MEIRPDAWLSRQLARDVRTVRAGDDDLAMVAGAIRSDLEAARPPVLYQSSVPAHEVRLLGALTDAGMGVVCASLALHLPARAVKSAEPLPGASAPGPGPQVAVREAQDTDAPAVLEIAQHAFTRSRFHLDPRLPEPLVGQMKRAWAESCLAGIRGDGVLVADTPDGVQGFLAWMRASDDRDPLRVIDLIAVAPEAQSGGAGRALVEALRAGAAGEGAALEVGTQTANPRATAFYERLGFVVRSSAYQLHLHAGEVSG